MARAGTGERFKLPLAVQFVAAWIGVWVGRQQAATIEYLLEENRALREKLGPGPIRLPTARRRRLAELGKKLGRKGLAKFATIGTPDTILRWYRELVARKYDGSGMRGPGRPRTKAEIAQLVVEMAMENPGWGYTRLEGALKNVGYRIGPSTVRAILKERGIEPAPQRKTRTSWATFLKAHMGAIAGADFFTVEALGLAGLVRYYVFFIIDIATRKVEIAGITRQPNGAWMAQVARNLLYEGEGFLVGKQKLIVDSDTLYTEEFRALLKRGGVEVMKMPAKSPNLNAYAERFVLSIKSECLDRVVPLGERHLRRVVSDYAKHYQHERNHQGIGNELIERRERPDVVGQIKRRERVGGMLKYYYREAA
jgi:transposase InsO family protein